MLHPAAVARAKLRRKSIAGIPIRAGIIFASAARSSRDASSANWSVIRCSYKPLVIQSKWIAAVGDCDRTQSTIEDTQLKSIICGSYADKFVVLPERRIVERPIGGLNRFRRLPKTGNA
jgi:hypothetical protein